MGIVYILYEYSESDILNTKLYEVQYPRKHPDDISFVVILISNISLYILFFLSNNYIRLCNSIAYIFLSKNNYL